MKLWHVLFLFILLSVSSCRQGFDDPVFEARRNVAAKELSAQNFQRVDELFSVAPVMPSDHFSDLPNAYQNLDSLVVTVAGDEMSLTEALRQTHTNALLVMKDGHVVYEKYFNGSSEETRFIGWSMSKSITSILVGIALEEGAIHSLDDKVSNYLPNLKSTVFADVRIRDLLLQRAGTSYSENKLFGKPDVDYLAEGSLFTHQRRFTDFSEVLHLKRKSASSKNKFNYSTLNSALLGRVVEEASGMSLAQYTQSKLWQPAGMQYPAYWMLDGKLGVGHAFAGGGFGATLRDYARVGKMMLQKGLINDRQILTEKWVHESTHYPSMEPVIGKAPRGYQYQWWTFLGTDIFEAVGIHGQTISVDPKTNTVIVKLSYWPKRGGGTFAKQNHQLLSSIRKHFE